jgi:hypothetical protein
VDESFKEAFTHVAGLTTARFSSIAAGARAVHTIVVRPQQPGYYNHGLTNAQIREQHRIAKKRAKLEYKQQQAQQYYYQQQYGYGYHPRRAPINPFR